MTVSGGWCEMPDTPRLPLRRIANPGWSRTVRARFKAILGEFGGSRRSVDVAAQ
jgi:hypothetical protein